MNTQIPHPEPIQPICYICHQTETTRINPLVQPCACASRHVHLQCLQQWTLQRKCDTHMTHCEVCLAPYWGHSIYLFGIMILTWMVNVQQKVVNRFLHTIECVI